MKSNFPVVLENSNQNYQMVEVLPPLMRSLRSTRGKKNQLSARSGAHVQFRGRQTRPAVFAIDSHLANAPKAQKGLLLDIRI